MDKPFLASLGVNLLVDQPLLVSLLVVGLLLNQQILLLFARFHCN